jgi:hypothetical protein
MALFLPYIKRRPCRKDRVFKSGCGCSFMKDNIGSEIMVLKVHAVVMDEPQRTDLAVDTLPYCS